jgi:hypothetical protein
LLNWHFPEENEDCESEETKHPEKHTSLKGKAEICMKGNGKAGFGRIG